MGEVGLGAREVVDGPSLQPSNESATRCSSLMSGCPPFSERVAEEVAQLESTIKEQDEANEKLRAATTLQREESAIMTQVCRVGCCACAHGWTAGWCACVQACAQWQLCSSWGCLVVLVLSHAVVTALVLCS